MSGGDERPLPPSRPPPLAGRPPPASVEPSARAPLGGPRPLDPSLASAAAPADLARAAGFGALREGARLGPYVLGRELARGAMGVVFVARHQALGREVALKVLLMPAHRAAPLQLQRFALEAQAAARLRHPHVVPIHDLGAAAGFHYLALDLVEGESLQRRLDRAGPLPPRVAARALEQAARGLQHAHEHGVLHRDMKPANLLLGADGRALVTDFGLAKDLHQGQALTATGELLGTPAYMPPEQADGGGKHVDARADVYSLGATLYAALTGQPPHQAAALITLLGQVLTEPVAPPSRLRPELPAALDAICLRALAKDPAARYPTAAALADDLARFVAGEAPQALGAQARARRPRGLALAAGALAALAVAAAAAALLTREESARRPRGAAGGGEEPARAAPARAPVWGWERRDVAGPPPRAWEAAVWDAARGEVVLLSGAGGNRPGGRTWTWDGTEWQEGASGPPPRHGRAMAYDAARERVVLLGGSSGGAGDLPVLWEWDGAAWSSRPLEGGPGALADHAVTYDRARQVLWVVGGEVAGQQEPGLLWSLDPASGAWAHHDASPAPSARRMAGVTFDPLRGRLIVFGGEERSRRLSDTWEWDGTRWHAFPDAIGPSPRRGAVMTFDGERALLVGGEDGEAVLDDLWAWDGARWRELTPAHGPPGRSRAAWVWLPPRREGLLFAASGPPSERRGETWVWRESAAPGAPAEPPAEPLPPPPARRWRQPWPGVDVPHPRAGHEGATVYDPLHREVVLFGGWDGKSAFDDMWTWRGTEDGWQRVPKDGPWPAPRIGHALAFDEARGRLVLYGGVPRPDQPPTDDLWEWDGARWELRRAGGPAPGPRSWHGFTYDPARGEVVLFGGDDGRRVHGDLWSWNGERWELLAADGPPPRSHPGLVADRRRGRLVLYGGLGLHESLWEWDGERWRRMRPEGPRPPELQAPRLVFDGERVLLHGGFSRRRGNVADLWSWDGARWERLEVGEGPSPRVWHGFAWDANRGVGVVFGGEDHRRRVADTWELVPAE